MWCSCALRKTNVDVRKIGGFSCRARLREGKIEATPGFRNSWKSCLAVWVHDVVIMYTGRGQIRMVPLPVAAVGGPPKPIDPNQVKRLGDKPFMVDLLLDGGQVVELAVREENRDRLLGSPPLANEEPEGGRRL